jgi:Asp-tRNA(Asn)/Glu-tRNA(Gln) amidotransferase C subunit
MLKKKNYKIRKETRKLNETYLIEVMLVTIEHFNLLEKLCSFSCTEEEKNRIFKNLSSMLKHLECIEHLAGEGLEGELLKVCAILHEDLPEKQLALPAIEKNAPAFNEKFITTFPLTYY